MRLDVRFRYAVYATFAILFLTGAGWLLVDPLKNSADGEIWQTASANLLMLHGGAAMIALLLLGAVASTHVRRAWRSRKNQITGTAMLTFNGVLVATSFGLYYSASDTLRPWMSNIHIAVGVCLPVLFLIHILVGRQSS